MALIHDPKWEHFRQQMAIVDRFAYFEHAAMSPLPRPTREAIGRWLAEAAEEAAPAWGRWERRLQEVRATAARMMRAAMDEIALIHSTTEGVAMVAEGFMWRAGDNVVIPADEFPANQYPWMHLAARGIETRRVESPTGMVDLNRLEDACDQRTRLVALSWVGYLSGWRTDLAAAAEMAHRHGALLFVDAIQGLGVFPVDVEQTKVDFLAAGGQKWQMGPEAAGLLYIRGEHLEKLRPLVVGSNSMVHNRDYSRIEIQLKPSAARHEGGAANSVGFIGLGASLDLLTSLGFDAIGHRVLEITDECCRRLATLGAEIFSRRDQPEHSSGIVSFTLPGCDLKVLHRTCKEQKVAVSQRVGYLRISPHAYNNNEDIDALIGAIETGKKVR
ncbi:MAG: aminotransferase class V-fold PLP-dependent enzyme [Pirellulales bacterium]|nr:aminotransferase class V-fold PLP-dependent enzyme [Pirellulales bacterium]